MAITPRSFLRNPLLLILALAVSLPAAFIVFASFCCTGGQDVDGAELAKVKLESSRNIATIQAQREQPPAVKAEGKGWLGIHIQTLDATRAKYAGVEPTSGVLVLDLLEGMSAQTSGFNPYDVVTHFNGQPVRTACQLKMRVHAAAPGTRVPVRVIRDGQPLVLYPTLGNAPHQGLKTTCGRTKRGCR
jgi:hypothetical protein